MAPINIDALMRAALRFLNNYASERMMQEEAPPPPRVHPISIGADPTTRAFVWQQICKFGLAGNFPGGREQFELACTLGWVRFAVGSSGEFRLEIGQPPQEPPPRSAPRDHHQDPPPPRPAKKTPAEIRAGALRVLGFKKDQSPDPQDVKDRYRDLARRHHPDLAHTPAKRERATDRMARINHAYDTLKEMKAAL
jgi:hypothetical protein